MIGEGSGAWISYVGRRRGALKSSSFHLEVSCGGELTVHVYAQCWNEVEMLPFFFRHYDGLVDQYFIYDDEF